MDELKRVNIANCTYIKPGITKEWLNDNNFKYNKILSDIENNIYTYRFPIHKNGCFTTLECELSCVELTGEIRVDVYEYGTRNRYAAFYCLEYGDYSNMLNAINKRINSELRKLGVNKIRKW